MNIRDIQSFFADEANVDKDAHVIFTYLFETLLNPMEAAAHLCQESSTAQWARPGVDEDFRPRHAAKIVGIETFDEKTVSSFGEAVPYGEKFVTARVRIAHPHCNFGARIPNLLTAAMGEGAFHCSGISVIKLLDIEFPDSYLEKFEGPKFGVKGIRNVLNVTDRPLFFGVVKPNVGLDPKSFADIAMQAWLGGLDVAKDDEMLSDAEYSPFAKRMELVGQAMKEAEDATGKKKMFIANITDEVDRLKELHDTAVRNGINAVMLNVMATGLSAVRSLRKISSVPIIAHFDCIAPMTRHPNFGVSTTVITKLQRLCGCDAIIMPGFGPRMGMSEEEVIANAAECAGLLGSIKSALPVPGGSDWAGTLPFMYEKLRTLDFAMVPGRGVFNHPMGPRAGAMSLMQAWDAVVQKIPLLEYAENHPELAQAITAFGRPADWDGTVGEPSQEIAEPPFVHGFTGADIHFEKG